MHEICGYPSTPSEALGDSNRPTVVYLKACTVCWEFRSTRQEYC